MSKWYKSQKTGINVISGKIKSISEDRMVMTVAAEEYDKTEKKNVPVEATISSGIPFEDDFKVGYSVTATGYQRGKGAIFAEAVSLGNDTYENEDLAVVSGLVRFARLNEEKNADGTPKMKQDGTPKKPHYDITVTARNNEGNFVNHVIKVYEGIHEDGKKSQMDIVSGLFKNFDRENNRARVTIVTSPGQSYTSTNTGKDGKEYTNFYCSHMGYKSLDVEFVDQKEKTQGAPTASKAPATQEKMPQTPVAPQPSVQSGNGFEQDLQMDEDEMFK